MIKKIIIRSTSGIASLIIKFDKQKQRKWKFSAKSPRKFVCSSRWKQFSLQHSRRLPTRGKRTPCGAKATITVKSILTDARNLFGRRNPLFQTPLCLQMQIRQFVAAHPGRRAATLPHPQSNALLFTHCVCCIQRQLKGEHVSILDFPHKHAFKGFLDMTGWSKPSSCTCVPESSFQTNFHNSHFSLCATSSKIQNLYFKEAGLNWNKNANKYWCIHIYY